jgi:hypothetical protein
VVVPLGTRHPILTFLAAIMAAMAPVPISAKQGFVLPCEGLKRNEDGSWSVTAKITLYTATNQVIIYPGETIKPGILYGTVDISGIINELEKRCK